MESVPHEAVCIFDLNIPKKTVQEYLERIAPNIFLFFLSHDRPPRINGRTVKKTKEERAVEDEQALERALIVRAQYPGIPCCFVTQDNGFAVASKYDPAVHPIHILKVLITSRLMVPAVAEQIVRFVRSLAPPSC